MASYNRLLVLLGQIKFRRQTAKQFKLHSLNRLWTLKNVANNIGPRWKIMLEYRLASTPHINQNRLSKMPPKEFIWWPLRIIKKSSIKMLPGNIMTIKAKVHDFMAILK